MNNKEKKTTEYQLADHPCWAIGELLALQITPFSAPPSAIPRPRNNLAAREKMCFTLSSVRGPPPAIPDGVVYFDLQIEMEATFSISTSEKIIKSNRPGRSTDLHHRSAFPLVFFSLLSLCFFLPISLPFVFHSPFAGCAIVDQSRESCAHLQPHTHTHTQHTG